MQVSPVILPSHRLFQYSLSLGWFHADLPLAARLDAARADGFKAVEMFWPAVEPSSLLQAKESSGVDVALVNMYEGTYARGDRGFLCDPDRSKEWRQRYLEGIAACATLDCSLMNVLTGDVPMGVTRADALHTARTNLEWAVNASAGSGVRIAIEPLNHLTHPNYLCPRTADAMALIADLPTETVGVQYDVYHAQCSEGNILNTLSNDIGRILHIQLADVPTRAKPGTGEVNFTSVLDRIAALGYDGFVGLEYNPSGFGDPFSWISRSERGWVKGE